jgi:TatA/E family protein of Tat protein translocase
MKLGDILVICLLVLLFWGPSRLSGLGKGIGEGIRNFRKSLRPDEGLQKSDPDRRDVPKT